MVIERIRDAIKDIQKGFKYADNSDADFQQFKLKVYFDKKMSKKCYKTYYTIQGGK